MEINFYPCHRRGLPARVQFPRWPDEVSHSPALSSCHSFGSSTRRARSRRFRVRCLAGLYIFLYWEQSQLSHDWISLRHHEGKKETHTIHLHSSGKYRSPWCRPPPSPLTAVTDVSGRFTSWLQCIFKQAQRQTANERVAAATLLPPPAACKKNL